MTEKTTKDKKPKRIRGFSGYGVPAELSFAVRMLPLHAVLTSGECAAWASVNIDVVVDACRLGGLRCIRGGTRRGNRIQVAWALEWFLAGMPRAAGERGRDVTAAEDEFLDEATRELLLKSAGGPAQ